jgi:hypothetical protein
LDTEWLLSTLFDASLLNHFKPPVFGGFFFASERDKFPVRRLGNHNFGLSARVLDSRPAGSNDLFTISRPRFGSFGETPVKWQSESHPHVKQ